MVNQNQIACNVELFDNKFNVFIFKNGQIISTSVPAANAHINLVDLCHQEKIYNLKLRGDETFLEGFIQHIYEQETTLYGKNGRINIEVID